MLYTMNQIELDQTIKRIREVRKANRCQHEWSRVEKKPVEICLKCRAMRFRAKLMEVVA